jgi:hypothetical protein
MKSWVFAMLTGLFVFVAGCGKEDAKPANGGGAETASTKKSGDDHHDHDHDHGHDHEHGEDHPESVPLGETAMNNLKIVATQHETPKPGSEAAFDVTVTGGNTKPKAVRFWVGTEDAKGSVKAKAEEEAGNAWHTHVEVPAPLPAGSKLWVEIEPADGATFKVSFDLKS